MLAYSSEDRVCVGYIDFGNSEEVVLNQLRPISLPLLALATQAIPCALAGKAKMFQLLGLSGGQEEQRFIDLDSKN